MTPLQKAAQALIDRWESLTWTTQPYTAHYIAELRKAMDAEQAQAVKPVAWQRTTESTKDSIWGTYGPNKVFDTDTPLYLHPPQQAKPKTMGDVQDMCIAALQRDERAQLIADCRAYVEKGVSAAAIKLARRAADMLEADDAFRPDWVNYRQGVKDGKADAATQESLTAQAQEGNMPDCWVVVKNGQILGTHDEPAHIDGLQAVRYVPAQQAKQVPMTTEELLDLMPTNTSMTRHDALEWMARAVERHHGIHAVDKPTDWSAA